MVRLSRFAMLTNTRPEVGSDPNAALWALANAVPKSASRPITSPVDFISGPRIVSTWRPSGILNRLNGITASFTAIGASDGRFPPSPAAGSTPGLSQRGDRLAQHHPGRGLGQRSRGRLGDERHRATGAWVGLQDVEHVGAERELDVQQAQHPHPPRDRPGRHADPVDLGRAQRDRGQGTRGVTRMDAGLLDVLHDATEEQVRAVEDRVDVDLHCVVDEPVDQHRMLGADLGRPLDVVLQAGVVVDDLHAPPAKDVRRPHEHWVADLRGDRLRLRPGRGHRVLRRRKAGLGEHAAERTPLLGQVNGLRRGADDRDAGVGQSLGQAERRLAAQLADHAGNRSRRSLRVDDLEDVFERQGFEVEPVAGVVVGRDGLGVAVDHDRLVARLAQGLRGVDARVVELDPLADPVGPTAEDDHGLLRARRDLGLLVVRAVVVGSGRGELGRTGVHRLVDRAHPERVPDPAYDVLAQVPDLADLRVGEAVPLGPPQGRLVQPVGCRDLGGHLVDQEQLVDEPRVDQGRVEDLIRRRAGPDRVHDLLEAAVVRDRDGVEKRFEATRGHE